jgi:flagellar basal-body rod protein FlgG
MTSSLFHTLNISKQDMITRLMDLDVVSNNLANVNTNGFKASRSNFQELLSQVIQRDGSKIASTQGLMRQGALRMTNLPFDWAIQGEGFFQVRLGNGQTAYTRTGEFSLDANRQIVTPAGDRLIWNGTIPDGYQDISISADGTVSAAMQDGTIQTCGTIQLAKFNNPSALKIDGKNNFLPTTSSGAAVLAAPNSANTGIVTAHQLEGSNVDMSREMTQLMLDQRTFQLSVKAFQQTDQMIGQAINLRKA